DGWAGGVRGAARQWLRAPPRRGGGQPACELPAAAAGRCCGAGITGRRALVAAAEPLEAHPDRAAMDPGRHAGLPGRGVDVVSERVVEPLPGLEHDVAVARLVVAVQADEDRRAERAEPAGLQFDVDAGTDAVERPGVAPAQ